MRINNITPASFKGFYVIDGNAEDTYRIKKHTEKKYLDYYDPDNNSHPSNLEDYNELRVTPFSFDNKHIQYIFATNKEADSIPRYLSKNDYIDTPSEKEIINNNFNHSLMRKRAQGIIEELLRISNITLKKPIQVYKAETVLKAIEHDFWDFVNGGYDV